MGHHLKKTSILDVFFYCIPYLDLGQVKNNIFNIICDEEICYHHSLKIFIEIATQKVNSQFTHEKETENQLYAVFKKNPNIFTKKNIVN